MQKNMLVAAGPFDPTASTTSVEIAPGQTVTIPTAVLLGAVRSDQPFAVKEEVVSVAATDVNTVIPVIAEELVVTKRVVPMETVRLVTTTEQVAEKVHVDLTRERWEITRIPVDVEVPARTDVRQEGDTSIYPVFEERLLTRTALFLTEEIYVRKTVETKRETLEADVQREVLTVERTQL